ncbi:MAG: metal-dependent hydrolase [Peptococcaceae bacterium MAG4]|nr:metal-dependent hydrolase [Peptococcaceae bacterium MAG4]
MLWRTHFLAGAAAGLLIAGNADVKGAAISASIAGIAALLPDLDDPKSKLGHLVAPASWAVKATVGHRGPLHSLLGVFAATLVATILNHGSIAFASTVAVGCLSHLVMDSLNPQGVPWLWPYKKRIGLPLVQTGSILEKLFIMPAVLIICLSFGVTFFYG